MERVSVVNLTLKEIFPTPERGLNWIEAAIGTVILHRMSGYAGIRLAESHWQFTNREPHAALGKSLYELLCLRADEGKPIDDISVRICARYSDERNKAPEVEILSWWLKSEEEKKEKLPVDIEAYEKLPAYGLF